MMLGTGLIKGLIETARNFFGSYHDASRLITISYPEQRRATPENNRNFPFLVYDGDPEEGLRCVSCKICEIECPPQCIYIEPEQDTNGRPRKHPKIFDIDISVCMSCQICVEVCPFDAIKMDQEFELSRPDRFLGSLLNKSMLAKANEYYHQLHPGEATETDARLEMELRQQEKSKAAEATAMAKSAPASFSPPTHR